VFAVGASCTHYGSALVNGLLAGGLLRCPLHHARFDIRTGEAVAAPALNPLPCWTVERRGDAIRVAGKRERRSPRQFEAARRIVIIGAGAAGNAAAEMLRREGYGGTLTMLGAENSVPYDRPNLSKDYLAGTAQAEWIPLRSPDFYRDLKIELMLGTRVAALDAEGRSVGLSNGRSLPFDACLLATGADPVRLPALDGGLPHVHYLRSLRDSEALIAGLAGVKRAVVLGASFIGLEVAASLRARNLEVDVVAPEARPLERILGPQVGDFIRALHEAHGVRFHLGQTAEKITPQSVLLKNGHSLPADLVVIGVGVRPATALAEQAGLAVEGGVTVDEFLETSAPGIFAAGDIARWPDPRSGKKIRVEHWVVAERQGQTAALNMLGRRLRFDAVPFFWSQHYDAMLSYVGHAESWERIEIAGDLAAKDATVSFHDKGRITAVATIGRDRVSLAAEAALERDDPAALREIVKR
jgi:NADPH-dependent 2,4-dienoyl-CoA reductase/sulfur reductase-like enzyme